MSRLLEPGEAFGAVEPLRLGGWWALSDRALYALEPGQEPARVPLAHIRSVEVHARSRTFAVVTTAGSGVLVGDLPKRSAVAAGLQTLQEDGTGISDGLDNLETPDDPETPETPDDPEAPPTA
ncbi:MAG TPA: hypothetical protein VE991_00040 [Acidimicrobiales bacterium]|nr:hypothetical protein [Acidimicrobiales bacterium]